jgi:GT2 family glycosyltransferase
MKISVIIPSYNPTLKLPATLDRLVSQSTLIDELIVIIDSDKHNDFAKLLEEKYSSILKIKVFPQPNSGRAISRNRGVELSSGDIIIFLDDDMLAENNLVEMHIRYHIENPGIIVSGNGYRNPADATYDFGKFLIEMEKNWKKNDTDTHEITLKKFDFTACNMSLPKDVFRQLGGFDTRFSDSEDFDFAIRAINQHIKIIYDNRLLAWHNDWPDIDKYIKRQNEYTAAKVNVFKIRPEYQMHFPNLQVTERSIVKNLISGIIRQTLGKWVISRNSIFEMLPVFIKFRLYRIIIFSYSNISK